MSSTRTYQSISLQEKMLRECDVMLKHATSKGLNVPPSLITDFTAIQAKYYPLLPLELRHRDLRSVEELNFTIQDVDTIARIHQALASIVSPALPYTLLFLQADVENKRGRSQIFGSVPLIRRMLVASIFCLLTLVASAFYPTTSSIITANVFELSGFDVVFAVLFSLAAAGLGASFYALYKARQYVSNSTFDPSYEATYWTEFILGLLSGLILSNIIKAEGEASQISDTLIISKVTLALLGGFASNVVYEFLNRLVQALASIVKPESKDLVQAEIREAKANVKEEFNNRKQELIENISDLQADLFDGKIRVKDIGGRLKNIVKDLTSVDGYVSDNTTTRPRTTTTTTTTTVDDIPSFIPPSDEIPDDVIPELDVPQDLPPDAVNPNMVEHYHEDDINSATEDEYITRV